MKTDWIKITTKKDLPKEKCICWVMDKTIGITAVQFLNNSIDETNFWLANATHYQIIQKPEPPIY